MRRSSTAIDTRPHPAYLSARMKSKIVFASVAVATLAIAFLFWNFEFILAISIVGEALRWLSIVLIAAIAIRRRSLTSWILVGLLAGAETGHDFPSFTANFQVLGIIFLRLIKTIIAPLLFGT